MLPERSRITLISTGGTIEKTYDPLSGLMVNAVSVLDVMLASLELPELVIKRVPLMNIDSLDMTAQDHQTIAKTAHDEAADADAVVVIHGTDRLQYTGEATYDLAAPRVPIVLTGAMRPYVMRNTDAVQNLTEALTAARLVPPGVYGVMHNKVLVFPGVVKDRDRGSIFPR